MTPTQSSAHQEIHRVFGEKGLECWKQLEGHLEAGAAILVLHLPASHAAICEQALTDFLAGRKSTHKSMRFQSEGEMLRAAECNRAGRGTPLDSAIEPTQQIGARCRQFRNCRSSKTVSKSNFSDEDALLSTANPRYSRRCVRLGSSTSQGGGLIQVPSRIRDLDVSQKVAMPQFEHQEPPNAG